MINNIYYHPTDYYISEYIKLDKLSQDLLNLFHEDSLLLDSDILQMSQKFENQEILHNCIQSILNQLVEKGFLEKLIITEEIFNKIRSLQVLI